MLNTVTLKDGRVVSSDSEEWKAECLERHNARRISDAPEIARHVRNMSERGSSADRRAYMDELKRTDGWMWAAVGSEFRKVWEAAQERRRRAAERMSVEGQA